MLGELLEKAKSWEQEPYIVFVFMDEETKGGWRTTPPIRIQPEGIALMKQGKRHTVYRPTTSLAMAEGILVGMFLANKDFPQMRISL